MVRLTARFPLLLPLRTLAVLLLVFAAVAPPQALTSQVVSPGRLSAAHAELEGLRRCTDCHELGRPGIDSERCLACHRPLATRIADGRGYHGRLTERNCATCHREHLGRNADLVRLDTASFRHEDAGFELRGAHSRLGCRSCHAPERVWSPDVRTYAGGAGFLARTLLGLPTTCSGCHRRDSPHGRQFERRSCDDCHDETRWEGAPRFDHGTARFRLTGAHRNVACDGCHRVDRPDGDIRYADIAHASCSACHADPHRGAMGRDCRDCHTTEGWHRVARNALEGRFDHDRTGFPLTGRHGDLECAACHQPGRGAATRIRFVAGTERFTYPHPVAGTCATCHLDPHDGEVSGACDACHRDTGWIPTTYGADRHASTSFPLEGGHVAVPCASCHRGAVAGGEFRFRLDRSCVACHADHDPHRGRFGSRPCEACHVPDRFDRIRFDHAPIEPGTCGSCHAADDPHGDQFRDSACDRCHGSTSFRITAFDHDRTAFSLDGAHATAPCSACHRPEVGRDGAILIRYRPLAVECRDCHGGAP